MMYNSLEKLNNEEISFLQQIRKELCLKSVQETVSLVTLILQALRQTLPLKTCTSLLNVLPDFLKLIFAANWKRNEQQAKIKHLDEFVYLVMERDKANKRPVCKNEIQTLSVIILTLKKLHKLIGLKHFEGLADTFWKELNDVPAEGIAAA